MLFCTSNNMKINIFIICQFPNIFSVFIKSLQLEEFENSLIFLRLQKKELTILKMMKYILSKPDHVYSGLP